MKRKRIFEIIFYLSAGLLIACQDGNWNNPYTSQDLQANYYYASFTEPPKTLDPARSYATNEAIFTSQIYEPPLQYHYLLRPYTLIPATIIKMPTVTYLDAHDKKLPPNATDKQIIYSVYDIEIKPGIFYQPHPAFAKDPQGNYYYHHLTKKDLNGVHALNDFKNTGTRELIADDYVYEIKRLAQPQVNSPILGVMEKYIVGLNAYADQLQKIYQKIPTKNNSGNYLDLRNYPLEGVKVIDRYHYQIKLKGVYPQFLYWLAMNFFAPIPWEADYFYSQPGMAERNINFDWYPVGTGPYLLEENNPNKRMVLARNPHFHGENYPTTGEPNDQAAGYLIDAGKPLPFIDKFIFTLEKESIPRWNKFLQGYYDQSAISSDSFDQAIHIDSKGQAQLTPDFLKKGIRLRITTTPSIFYMGFNMLDDTVGGNDERARKLRQAIAIALDYEEFIAIFLNGRGEVAQGPISPGIFGYLSGREGMNPYVYFWQNGEAKRKPISIAKTLLAEAGYPDGRDKKTGKPLTLSYDAVASSAPDDKAQFDWFRKQFAKLGIELNIRATQYNRFQEKVRNGDVQIFSWGWSADYPDPENFLFLLYGPNSRVKTGGENTTNYHNPNFDELFTVMKNTPNGSERQKIISQMVAMIQQDEPWPAGFYAQEFVLSQQWVRPSKPNPIANNVLKYARIDPALRAKLVKEWNTPIIWPLWIMIILVILILLPAVVGYWRKIHIKQRH